MSPAAGKWAASEAIRTHCHWTIRQQFGPGTGSACLRENNACQKTAPIGLPQASGGSPRPAFVPPSVGQIAGVVSFLVTLRRTCWRHGAPSRRCLRRRPRWLAPFSEGVWSQPRGIGTALGCAVWQCHRKPVPRPKSRYGQDLHFSFGDLTATRH